MQSNWLFQCWSIPLFFLQVSHPPHGNTTFLPVFWSISQSSLQRTQYCKENVMFYCFTFGGLQTPDMIVSDSLLHKPQGPKEGSLTSWWLASLGFIYAVNSTLSLNYIYIKNLPRRLEIRLFKRQERIWIKLCMVGSKRFLWTQQ